MSYKDIEKLLKDENPIPSTTSELQKQDASEERIDKDTILNPVVKVVKPISKFVSEWDDKYKRGCQVESVDNAVRVEQGEFAVSRKSGNSPALGTHHVNPCVVICVTSNNFFGLAHFDSYRTLGSLEEFFKQFKNDGQVNIQIFGGKPGSDQLRSGTENKNAVMDYIQFNFPNAKLKVNDTVADFINLVFDKNGTVQHRKFAVGIGVDEDLGALMRLRHAIGGVVTAQQSRSGHFMPLNFSRAYQGVDQLIFLDRLTLKALSDFDPSPIPGEENAWSIDPGGHVLTEELRFAHTIVSDEVKAQKLSMESELKELVDDAALREELITICPIYIGPSAEVENSKLVKILARLCSEERSDREIVNNALLLFNKASPYPLVAEIIPQIEKAYNLKEDSLKDALQEKFGNIRNLAYGIDLLAPDVAKIINDRRQQANPGLVVTQNLKFNSVEIGTLWTSLSAQYGIKQPDLLAEVTEEFNKAITEDSNIDKIIAALDEKNITSKNNVLQVLTSHYRTTPAKMKYITKILDSVWDSATDPKEALESIITKIDQDANFDWAKEYNDLAQAFHLAHLQPRDALKLEQMSFDDNQTGVQGVIGRILKDSIINIMLKNESFAEDFAQESVSCGELTRTIRDSIPYREDKTADLAEDIDQDLRKTL